MIQERTHALLPTLAATHAFAHASLTPGGRILPRMCSALLFPSLYGVVVPQLVALIKKERVTDSQHFQAGFLRLLLLLLLLLLSLPLLGPRSHVPPHVACNEHRQCFCHFALLHRWPDASC